MACQFTHTVEQLPGNPVSSCVCRNAQMGNAGVPPCISVEQVAKTAIVWIEGDKDSSTIGIGVESTIGKEA